MQVFGLNLRNPNLAKRGRLSEGKLDESPLVVFKTRSLVSKVWFWIFELRSKDGIFGMSLLPTPPKVRIFIVEPNEKSGMSELFHGLPFSDRNNSIRKIRHQKPPDNSLFIKSRKLKNQGSQTVRGSDSPSKISIRVWT